MIAQTASSWRFLWFKEWFLPKAGTAVVVATLSAILFSQNSDAWINDRTMERFDSIFAKTSHHWFPAAIVALELLLFLATWARVSKDGKTQRDFLPLVRLAPKLALGMNAVLGMLLVPLVVALTYATMNRPSVANQLLVILSVYAVAYVVLSAANHRRMYELGISTQHIAYTLMPLQPKTLEQAVHETGGRLGEILSHVPLVDDPVIAGHTKDRQITLIVNLRLDWEYWSDRQRADLNPLLILHGTRVER
ncbi:hypothetical protein [Paraburkholderia strydomiana]|uniref:hypothetical protein n=1 Tax=Paraburkholderia strydomiana TaxID=1245417 RepID=UPI0038BA2378